MILRAIVIWLGLMILAVANGLLREAVIRPRTGELTGHIISTLILCVLILAVALLSIGWIGPSNARQAFEVGVLWLLLTLTFEFLAGHYVFGNPWEKILADYNVLRGRIWVLIPITTLLAPWLAARIRGIG